MADTKFIEEFRERKQCRWEGRPNYMMSTWGRMLQSERVTLRIYGKCRHDGKVNFRRKSELSFSTSPWPAATESEK